MNAAKGITQQIGKRNRRRSFAKVNWAKGFGKLATLFGVNLGVSRDFRTQSIDRLLERCVVFRLYSLISDRSGLRVIKLGVNFLQTGERPLIISLVKVNVIVHFLSTV